MEHYWSLNREDRRSMGVVMAKHRRADFYPQMGGKKFGAQTREGQNPFLPPFGGKN